MIEEEAPLVLQTKGGLSISYRGRLLYSGREPERLPRRVAAACDPGPGRLHLVPSPLLWHGVSELLAAIGEGSALLCIEAEAPLAALARERMPPELAADPRVSFVETSSVEDALDAALAMGDFRFCSLDALSGGEALHAELYRAMARAIGGELEAAWRNRAALMVLGRRWARNIFDNLTDLPDILPAAAPRFPGAVAVCGAGPSLEDALPFLSAERGRLSIVACDTALGSLLAAGVEPDLVVCLEGQAHNLPDFTPLGSRPIGLLADLSSHPATFRAIGGPKHLSLVRITQSPFLDRTAAALSAAALPFLDCPPLGSVGVQAYFAARALSGGPLFACGLDFSYPAGKSHARGCPSLLAEERHLDRLTRWPGQYCSSFRDRTLRLEAARSGGSEGLLSDPILLSYALLLEERVRADLISGAAALYDLRGRGPGIGGARITLNEASAILAAAGYAATAPSAAASRDATTREAGCREAARSILAEETGRLRRLRRAMHGQETMEETAFRRLVLESDYLWWSFPDQGRLLRSGRAMPQDFLNRLVPEAEWWALRLEGLEERLS
jgi:hypothetical protein